ncbi:transmembrane protein 104 homolog isoform X1 [Danaus plexippus]|uniref:Transmembrane protein 104 n=2 Tax=Danaus plexippus TaxID=13037 RepID=A0A212F1T6_DANPL|nr:transmembrane protein 104 homolog isoform X1 [Danaus plexippus]OWR47673.1 transmembrane protein 104 [Danaus plexippus plexippus]
MPRRPWIIRRIFRMPVAETSDQYSVWVGLIYIFNLIVGTGALTLPAAFARAGWGLSTISLVFLAFMSFMNATYVVETMACANAVFKWKRLQFIKRNSVQENESDEEATSQNYGDMEDPLVCGDSIPSRYYSLDNRIELGEMANLFLNKTGRTMFYCTLCVYLYGDLSIYSAAVSKSLMDVICTTIPSNMTNSSDWDVLPCFVSSGTAQYTRFECYRISLLTFFGVMGPFVFFNVQKTKYLQLFTSGMRWLAFAIMITMAIHLLVVDGPQGRPPAFDFTGMPTLFGACVYSFMCHHSLPALISPIRGKSRLNLHLSLDYALISIFYLLLAFTGAFAFANLNDLYTLNFVPTDNENIFLEIVEYFLALFPVFTLSTSFPIIAITLRNNLQSLFLDTSRLDSYNFVLRKLVFPVVAVVPPLLLTYFLEDISILIKFTGSYAGTGIQYLMPTFLVLSARRHCSNLLGLGVVNKYKSPFSNVAWAAFVLMWSFMCIILVSVNMFERR